MKWKLNFPNISKSADTRFSQFPLSVKRKILLNRFIGDYRWPRVPYREVAIKIYSMVSNEPKMKQDSRLNAATSSLHADLIATFNSIPIEFSVGSRADYIEEIYGIKRVNLSIFNVFAWFAYRVQLCSNHRSNFRIEKKLERNCYFYLFKANIFAGIVRTKRKRREKDDNFRQAAGIVSLLRERQGIISSDVLEFFYPLFERSLRERELCNYFQSSWQCPDEILRRGVKDQKGAECSIATFFSCELSQYFLRGLYFPSRQGLTR